MKNNSVADEASDGVVKNPTGQEMECIFLTIDYNSVAFIKIEIHEESSVR